MIETVLTIGLFDKDQEIQLISTENAHTIVNDTILAHGIYAFTTYDCHGVYRMNSTGNIVREPSIRVEIATDTALESLHTMIECLKSALNQETIMVKTSSAAIDFI